MTSHTSGNTSWKRAMTVFVATGALAAGLSIGLASTALAKPADPAADSNGPPPMTAEQVLAIIDTDYDKGAGGGQLSNLIHQVMKLRSQGFMPSNANKDAIVAALDHRPDQEPLIEALQATLVYQKRMQARSQAATVPPSSTTVGINQPNPNSPGSTGGFTITPPSQ